MKENGLIYYSMSSPPSQPAQFPSSSSRTSPEGQFCGCARGSPSSCPRLFCSLYYYHVRAEPHQVAEQAGRHADNRQQGLRDLQQWIQPSPPPPFPQTTLQLLLPQPPRHPHRHRDQRVHGGGAGGRGAPDGGHKGAQGRPMMLHSFLIVNIMKIEKAEDVEMVLKTNKDSESGIFSNERLLMIKAGIVSYFSEVSKKFTGSAKFIESSGQFPKYTIRANDIDHMELKAGVLSMLFKKSKLISRNEFQDMVRKKEVQPDRASEMSVKEENSGFIKWTFQCENPELMKEFFRLTNLFRSNNPKFHPSLNAVLSSFRGEKRQPQARQLSMKPSTSDKMYQDLNKKRMSEVPVSRDGKDLFLESLGIMDKKTDQDKIQAPVPSVTDEAATRAELAKQTEMKESERLSKLISRISVLNQPVMETILERDNEDKLSEMSRNVRDTFTEKKLELRHTESLMMQFPVQEEKKEEKEVKGQNEERKEEKIVIEQIEEKPAIQQFSQPNIQISSSQIEEMVFDLDQPSTQQCIVIEEKPELPVQTKPLEVIVEEPKPKKQKPIEITLNNSYENDSIITQDESKKKKRKKLQQFFKATSYADHFDPQEVCRKLSISLQDLQELMKTHTKEEESAWAFIQNNLAYQLAREKLNPDKAKSSKRLNIHDELIEDYYQLGEARNEESFQFLKMSLDQDISYISAESKNEQEIQALRWMEEQMKDSTPKEFASKIMKKVHFKIYIRPIDFRRENIIHLKSGWIVNKNGHLEEFLAYLRLEKILKQISANLSDSIELVCADAIFLRYKQYEGIAKQWRIGHPCLPIKSIKALEYITRSKEMKLFHRDYPQFNIITEIIKEGFKYRLHLDRIEGDQSEQNETALLNELRKLIFPFDNELDLFYNNPQYSKIEDHCLAEIQAVMEERARIEKDDMYAIMETMENNISVDTLCKLLCCRIDKKGNIYFHHTILRLGGRQFGQEISLIKRSKKKGNLQLGRELSKRLMGRLQQYQNVTPISHFIQIYLQIIDFMIVNEGELHRAVPILLKVLSHLGECEAEQYPIYLSLMKTYLKLNQMENFIKTLQNCRLFISKMFKQYSPLLDYPLQRIIIMILLKENTERALLYSRKIIAQLKESKYFSDSTKEKYISKIEWDKNNILISMEKAQEAFNDCFKTLLSIEDNNYYPDYWIEGVLCLSKSWLQISQSNSINGAEVQRRIARALELAFSRENMEMVFVLYQSGLKVLNKCKQLDLPIFLDSNTAFEQAKIEFHQTQAEIFYLLTNNS